MRRKMRRWGVSGGLLWGLHAGSLALQVPAPVLPQAAVQPALPASGSEVSVQAAGKALELGHQLGRLVDAWIHQGDESPTEILDLLQRMETSEPPPAGVSAVLWRHTLWHAQALIAARTGMIPSLQAALGHLRELDPERREARVRADQALALAQYATLSGDAGTARSQAQAAQQDYALVCEATVPSSMCSLRAWWYSLDLMAEQARVEGHYVQAQDWSLRARKIAQRAGDQGLEVRSALGVAYAQHALGQYTQAEQTLQQMTRPVQGESLQVALLHWRVAEAALGQAQLPRETQLLKLTEAWELSQQIGAPRLSAQVQLALARYWLESRPQRALTLAEEALRALRLTQDVPLQAQLHHVSGLARLLLRQPTGPGERELKRAQDVWQASGAWAHQAAGWREASVIFERLGRVAEALQYFHQERVLLERIEQDNRQAFMAQLREQFAVAKKQRELDQLSRTHALETAQLDHQALVVRLVVLTVAFLVLISVLVLLLAMRARDLTRRLSHSEGELRLQSERDALTGLANRRHVSNRLQTAHLYEVFQGGIMLLDIDHFKHINDEQGHAAGDAVLVEVAERLLQVVGEQGLVSRWGGEEFLVWVDDPVASLDALAQRVLHAIGDVPVVLADGQALRVTVSMGHGLFPLLGSSAKLGWERALKLVDMLLYAAKQQGRDRAIGLQTLSPSVGPREVDALDCHADVQALGPGTQLSVYRRQTADFSVLMPSPTLPHSATSLALGSARG